MNSRLVSSLVSRRSRPSPRLGPVAGLVLLLGFALVSSVSAPARAANAISPSDPQAPSEAPPLRVATLLPFVEDALAHARDRASVVASIRRSVHVPLEEGLVDLGNPHAPNLEQLASARPDLVIADRDVHARFMPAFRALGARVLMLETGDLDSTFAALDSVSEAIGGSAPLDARIAAARASIESLRVEGNPRVLALFGSPGSFYVMTERAWLGDLAARLGFAQTVDGPESERFPGLVPVSDEVMALARPDLVLLVAHGDPAKIEADLVQRTASGGPWKGLARARFGIHVLDPNLFATNPGLDLVDAARTLQGLAGGTPDVAAGSEPGAR